ESMDPRVLRHAELLVNWSTRIQEGEMVLIIAYPEAYDLVLAIVEEVAKKRASYLVQLESNDILQTYLEYADNRTLSLFPKHYQSALEASDVVIGINAPRTINALANSDVQKLALRAKAREPLLSLYLSKKWCDTLHPCDALAQQAGMTLDEYRNFVYDAILIDWSELSKQMSSLVKQLNTYPDIHLIGPGTDLYAETSGRIWMIENGTHNMPSGEIYTSPMEESVEGTIHFDVPFLYQGKLIEGVKLRFQKGCVVDYDAVKGVETLKSIIELDDGSSRLGEIAIGMNRGISKYTKNMLFDEKMSDSIHCALGKALQECNGENQSAIHVDMVKNMLKGEILAGGVSIYKHGEFLA
ncbi:MAG: aminopeptidase, partial [Candidatus Thorarchaeota archaeon]